MSSRVIAVVGLVAALGVGGYFAYQQWFLAPPAPIAPDFGTAQKRESVPVPLIAFKDVTAQAGIAFEHVNGSSGRKLLPETMGGGVAILDYDNDGHQDIFLVNSCPWPGHEAPGVRPTSQLYRNKGDGTFEDVTNKAGFSKSVYGIGVAVGDFDNDGDPDLFVSCVGRNHLYRNDSGIFVDCTDTANVGGEGSLPTTDYETFLKSAPPIPFGSSATFVDYDNDGRLDLFVCHYVTWSPAIDLTISSTLRGGARAFAQPREFDGGYCALYRNIDGKSFEDVSDSAGIRVSETIGQGAATKTRAIGKSLGVILCDPDDDGWPDLVVANDTVRNFFFHNVAGPNGTRRFEEVGESTYVAYADEGRARGGMGIDYGEYAPGKSALLIANFAQEPNTFLRRNSAKPLRFSDAALSIGLAAPSRSPLKFGAFFVDYDLDSRLDLFTCNGHIEPDIASVQGGQSFAQSAQLFWNTGQQQPIYEPVATTPANADLFAPIVGRGAAYFDYDHDGDLDFVLVSNGGPAKLIRNDQQTGNHWIRVNLVGDGVSANRSAIGAELTITFGGQTIKRTITGAKGYISQCEPTMTVGLGAETTVDKLVVRWPAKGNPTQTWTNLKSDQAITLAQGQADPIATRK